ncbi:CDP-alcohol phosphatidyltransferase family protein [Kocuria sp.]|uniref:CDP-alcohol phosphatidyltransferase family protein n=1 Tax=Kocuria sp. TaxID=1871328 RepID=UPI0026DABBAA|nr:CDP-alcohol phosphatidyltransferase family protein [Kocuria sp.]MDO4919010.1 CDP-alcohol phosphatidyltransferase family protein [Kocuria sp.]
MVAPDPHRRPIPQRSARWAAATARALQRAGLHPNHISVASVVTALVGCACLVLSAHADDAARTLALLLAAVCIPLRLLCNMLDGMLAVEGGLRTPTGELYNEVPDRVSDLALLAGAGYAASSWAGGVTLGWLAGSLAVLTAYVRTLGVSTGCAQQFGGVLPKQRRMWLLMAGILLGATEPWWGWPRGAVLWCTLVLVVVGCALTVVTRLRAVSAQLRVAAGERGGDRG